MVLFLFVIMLLNIEAVPREWKRWPAWLVAGGITAFMGAELVRLRAYSPERLAREFSTMPDSMAVPAYVFPSAAQAMPDPRGVVGRIAEPLFQGYLIPFEITSVLLLAAVIGAVVLAKKRL
jgi:NADH-quinone oxidoreductase subunit J